MNLSPLKLEKSRKKNLDIFRAVENWNISNWKCSKFIAFKFWKFLIVINSKFEMSNFKFCSSWNYNTSNFWSFHIWATDNFKCHSFKFQWVQIKKKKIEIWGVSLFLEHWKLKAFEIGNAQNWKIIKNLYALYKCYISWKSKAF